MDRKNSVLATMFIPEPGLPSIKLENNKMSCFHHYFLVLGAFNIVSTIRQVNSDVILKS